MKRTLNTTSRSHVAFLAIGVAGLSLAGSALAAQVDFSAVEGFATPYDNVGGVTKNVDGMPGVTMLFGGGNWNIHNDPAYTGEADHESTLGLGYARFFGNASTITFSAPVSIDSLAYTTFVTYTGTYDFVGSLGGVIKWDSGLISPPAFKTWNYYTGGAGTMIDKLTINKTAAIGAIDTLVLSPIPEPGTLSLIGLGLAALTLLRRRS